jgi:rRNA maturation RNase YbeY
MERVTRLNPERNWTQLSVALTDDAGIAAVHGDFLHDARPTDVISFHYAPQPAQEGDCAEVVVNVQRAVDIGPQFRGSAYELALYITHGCHHLSGADDTTPAGQHAMRCQEEAWLAEPEMVALIAKMDIR